MLKHSDRLELIAGAGIDSPALRFLANSDLRDLATIKGVRRKKKFIAICLRLQILKFGG